jgi:hypothetical protein
MTSLKSVLKSAKTFWQLQAYVQEIENKVEICRRANEKHIPLVEVEKLKTTLQEVSIEIENLRRYNKYDAKTDNWLVPQRQLFALQKKANELLGCVEEETQKTMNERNVDGFEELKEIVWDSRANDGTWCSLPYPIHPKGCPRFPICVKNRLTQDELIKENRRWFAVIETFDLKHHAALMKQKHPDWSERQCRCLLYWQNHVRKKLLNRTYEYSRKLSPSYLHKANIILEVPEANGINVFATMAKVGVILQKNPDIVKKIMLIGVTQDV